MPMISQIIAASHSRMSVTAETSRAPAPVGLSSHTTELWLAALRHRGIADALAAAAAARKQA